jgi:hypothetical protein
MKSPVVQQVGTSSRDCGITAAGVTKRDNIAVCVELATPYCGTVTKLLQKRPSVCGTSAARREKNGP